MVSEEIETLLQAYHADACTAAELRKLHLPRNLALEDRFALLQFIWRYRVGWSAPEAVEHHTHLWVWLTHLDQMLAYPPGLPRSGARPGVSGRGNGLLPDAVDGAGGRGNEHNQKGQGGAWSQTHKLS